MLLKELVLKKDNEYSHLEEKTRERGLDLIWTSVQNTLSWLNESISVIMPCYNVSYSLPKILSALEAQSYKNFEVIVVDDCSSEDLVSVIKDIDCTFDLSYVRNQKNRDRSFARNTGLSIANGSTILILDPDMVPCKHYLLNLAARQGLLEKSILCGFKHHVERDDSRIVDDLIKKGEIYPNISEDWRVQRKYDSSIIPPNFMGIHENESRRIRILEESNFFRNLGKGKILGAWDLPSLVIGHSICFKKQDGIAAGGFAEEFVGWGHDDIAFAVRMIAHDNYVIPCIHSVAYHINHPPYSGSREQKLIEFRSNLKRFMKYINNDLNEICFIPHNVKKTNDIGNKHFYEGP